MGRKSNDTDVREKVDLRAKPWEEYFGEARNLYQLGAAGDEKAARQALSLLEQLWRQIPGNNLLQAYYGSAYILKAREEPNLVTKGKISHHGLKILDGALANEPDNIEIRIVHAFVCKNLPDWLNRGPDAIADFEYLKSRYEADTTVFSEQFYLQLQTNIAEIQKKIAAVPANVQKIYDHFSNLARKKQTRS